MSVSCTDAVMPFFTKGKTAVPPFFQNLFYDSLQCYVVVGGVASGFLPVLGSLGYSPSLSVLYLSVSLFIQPSTSFYPCAQVD